MIYNDIYIHIILYNLTIIRLGYLELVLQQTWWPILRCGFVVCSSQELGLSELTNAMIIDSGKTWGYNWDIYIYICPIIFEFVSEKTWGTQKNWTSPQSRKMINHDKPSIILIHFGYPGILFRDTTWGWSSNRQRNSPIRFSDSPTAPSNLKGSTWRGTAGNLEIWRASGKELKCERTQAKKLKFPSSQSQ